MPGHAQGVSWRLLSADPPQAPEDAAVGARLRLAAGPVCRKTAIAAVRARGSDLLSASPLPASRHRRCVRDVVLNGRHAQHGCARAAHSAPCAGNRNPDMSLSGAAARSVVGSVALIITPPRLRSAADARTRRVGAAVLAPGRWRTRSTSARAAGLDGGPSPRARPFASPHSPCASPYCADSRLREDHR